MMKQQRYNVLLPQTPVVNFVHFIEDHDSHKTITVPCEDNNCPYCITAHTLIKHHNYPDGRRFIKRPQCFMILDNKQMKVAKNIALAFSELIEEADFDINTLELHPIVDRIYNFPSYKRSFFVVNPGAYIIPVEYIIQTNNICIQGAIIWAINNDIPLVKPLSY